MPRSRAFEPMAPQRAEPAVGRGRPAHRNDDVARAALDRGEHQFAGAVGGGVEGVVVLRPAGAGKA